MNDLGGCPGHQWPQDQHKSSKERPQQGALLASVSRCIRSQGWEVIPSVTCLPGTARVRKVMSRRRARPGEHFESHGVANMEVFDYIAVLGSVQVLRPLWAPPAIWTRPARGGARAIILGGKSGPLARPSCNRRCVGLLRQTPAGAAFSRTPRPVLRTNRTSSVSSSVHGWCRSPAIIVAIRTGTPLALSHLPTGPCPAARPARHIEGRNNLLSVLSRLLKEAVKGRERPTSRGGARQRRSRRRPSTAAKTRSAARGRNQRHRPLLERDRRDPAQRPRSGAEAQGVGRERASCDGLRQRLDPKRDAFTPGLHGFRIEVVGLGTLSATLVSFMSYGGSVTRDHRPESNPVSGRRDVQDDRAFRRVGDTSQERHDLGGKQRLSVPPAGWRISTSIPSNTTTQRSVRRRAATWSRIASRVAPAASVGPKAHMHGRLERVERGGLGFREQVPRPRERRRSASN